MSKNYDDELPASTLGGVAEKFVAQRIDRRYVPSEPPGPLHIAARPAPDIDPEKNAAFKNVPGPPSIVDTIIQFNLGCTTARSKTVAKKCSSANSG